MSQTSTRRPSPIVPIALMIIGIGLVVFNLRPPEVLPEPMIVEDPGAGLEGNDLTGLIEELAPVEQSSEDFFLLTEQMHSETAEAAGLDNQALGLAEMIILEDPDASAEQPEASRQAFLDASRMFIGEAAVAHNAPETMDLDRRYDMELAFVPEGVELEPQDVLSRGLPGPAVVADGIEFGNYVQATLVGNDFAVTPAGPQRRRVLGDREILWAWQVEPLVGGSGRRLTFVLEALVFENGTYEVVTQETYRADVLVQVGWMDWAGQLLERAQPFAAAIAGVITFLIGLFTFYLTFIRKRPEASG